MFEPSPPSPAVIVGIDGSRSAVDAALWAIDEAVDRDLPLRLLYAIEHEEASTSNSQSLAHQFATAEAAVRQASMAIELTERPVKIEIEIVQGLCEDALVAASRSAAVVCVGARGLHADGDERVGSTTTHALVERADCPVAIVRRGAHLPSEKLCIAVEFAESAGSITVLHHAMEEARLRSAPLRVLVGRRPGFSEVRDDTGRQCSRAAKTELEHSLTSWRARYPALDIRAVAVPGNPLTYLARHIDSIGLIVIGSQPCDELSELVARAEVNELDCSVLVCRGPSTSARVTFARGDKALQDIMFPSSANPTSRRFGHDEDR